MSEIYSGSETFRSFLEIGKSHPPLTADEERQMTDAYFKADHDKWKEIMILHSMRFAIAQSDRYTVRGEERVDIICRLIGGLTEAANRFDPSKGVRFLTFAGFYLKNSMRDAIDTNLVAVRTNNATMAIMDKRVDGKDKDSSATVGDFVGNFQSPDFNAIDPASDERRTMSEKYLREIIDHFCTAIDVLPDGERKNRILSAFRIRFGEGLKAEEIADRIGVSSTSVKYYLHEAVRLIRYAIDKGCVTMREWQAFVTDDNAGAAVKDIDASEAQFTEDEIADAIEDAETIADVESSHEFIQEHPRAAVDANVERTKEPETDPTSSAEDPENEKERYQDVHRTVYTENDFYSGTNNSVLKKSGQIIDIIDQDNVAPVNAGNTMFSRIALFKVDGRKSKRKGTWHSKPFFGNFYSEWNRMMQMRRSARIVTGPRVIRMLEEGIIRKEDCFRLSGGTIACRIR